MNKNTMFSLLNKPEDFFFLIPSDNKPPFDCVPYHLKATKQYVAGVSSKEINGWHIYVALAGFRKKDVEVTYLDNFIIIRGDICPPSHESQKFSSKFTYKFGITEELDITRAAVEFRDGLLNICIPVNEKNPKKETLLFGSVPDYSDAHKNL